MHVGKASVQLALTRQMHGRRDSVFPRPAGSDVMVECEIVENTR